MIKPHQYNHCSGVKCKNEGSFINCCLFVTLFIRYFIVYDKQVPDHLCNKLGTRGDLVSLPNDEVLHVPVLMTNSHPIPASRSHTSIIEESYVWLERVRTLAQQAIELDEWISWAAYHANTTETPATPPTKSYMFLIFLESSNSPIMVWHGMTVLHRVIIYLNPGQTPVMVADQPLFTLAKKLQWKFPQTDHGEDSFLVTLGAMYAHREDDLECVC